MMAYRSSVQESTQCTLNLLMLGREISLPVDLMFERRTVDSPICPIEYIEVAAQNAFEFVQERLILSAQRQKRLYDQHKQTSAVSVVK